MDYDRAEALAVKVREAGFTANVKRVNWGSYALKSDASAPFYVEAEVNSGWTSYFDEDGWRIDPSNPLRELHEDE